MVASLTSVKDEQLTSQILDSQSVDEIRAAAADFIAHAEELDGQMPGGMPFPGLFGFTITFFSFVTKFRIA